jgi:hypothetical protein
VRSRTRALANTGKGAEDWPCSSERVHVKEQDDGPVRVRPMLERIERFSDLIAMEEADDPGFGLLRAAETTDRPAGRAELVADLERRLERPIARRAAGRKSAQNRARQRALL